MNIDFICTYNLIKDLDDSELLYKIQLLQVFNLGSFDEKVILEKQNNLFNTIKDNSQIKEILNLIKKKHSLNDDFISFQLLFSFHYLNYFHYCMRDIINNNEILESNYNNLINIL